MGLHTILKKQRLKEKEIRLLILGLDSAGKTTILKKISGEDISTVSPTLGFNIKTLEFGGYKLNIWDVGGQKALRGYWRNYFERTNMILWVVDSTDRLRIDDCRFELHSLLQEERLMGSGLFVFCNKIDIQGCMEPSEINNKLALDELKTHKHHLLPCSAVTGENLAEGMLWIVENSPML